jgi:hypothetical protein
MKFIGFALTAGIGVYFTLNTLWSDYITAKKKKSLSLANTAICSVGSMSLGVLMGGYFLNKNSSALIKKKMTTISQLKILLGVSLLYFIAVEQLERNLFYWGSGTVICLA